MKHTTAGCPCLLLALALAGCGGGDDPPKGQSGKDAPPPHGDAPAVYFVDITRQLGLPAPTTDYPEPRFFTTEITPGGVALFDYDNDGDLDIYQVRHAPPGKDWATAIKQPAPNRLFRNDGGKFTEIPGAAGLDDPGYGHGCAIGDIDGDGDLDVYVTNHGPDALYSNNGDGTFSKANEWAGIGGDHWSSAAAFFDYDRDGDLDLYVVHFATFDPSRVCKQSGAAMAEYCGPHTFPGVPDTLYRNNGDGTLTDVSKDAGIVIPARGWGVLAADFTGDGLVDVYVANDEEPNQLWVNRGDGTFVDEAVLRGCAVNGAGNSEASMGVATADLNRDGRRDLFMTHIGQETNTLFMSEAAGDKVSFRDKSAASAMSAIDLPFTGWGCGFFDFDHDGVMDVAIANGKVARGKAAFGGADEARLGKLWAQYAEPNLLFRGTGDGKFSRIGDEGGDFVKHIEVTRGLAFGDIDNDGDIDLATNAIDNTLRIYRNDAPKKGHWLTVRAVAGKLDAIGAEVTITTTGGGKQTGLVQPSYSYLASNDPRVHFGLGDATAVEAIELVWPDGTKETFPGVAADQIVTVIKGDGR